MAEQVAICNLALGRISARPIIAIDVCSVESDVMLRIWQPVLDEVLRANNWSFAQVVEALALVSGYTPYGWAYAYGLPTSSLAIWKLYNTQTNLKTKPKGEDFRELFVKSLNQKVILTNCVEAYAEYTFKIADPTIFTPDFVSVLGYRLAAEAAMPINADPQQAINMTKLYTNQLSETQRASSYDNQVNNGQPASMFVDARMGESLDASVSIGGQTFDQFNRNT